MKAVVRCVGSTLRSQATLSGGTVNGTTPSTTTISVPRSPFSSSSTNNTTPAKVTEEETSSERAARIKAAETLAFAPIIDRDFKVPSWWDGKAHEKRLEDDSKRAVEFKHSDWATFQKNYIHRQPVKPPTPPSKLAKPLQLPSTQAFRTTYPYGWISNPTPKDTNTDVKVELKEELKGMFQSATVPSLSVVHQWQPESVRVGAVAKKMGMVSITPFCSVLFCSVIPFHNTLTYTELRWVHMLI
jgi:hypothetical protein